jgi:hypothetical protein
VFTSAAGAAAFVLAGFKPLSVTDIGSLSGAVGPQLADLNPDRMWPVYRRYHLLIVGQRDDEQGNGFAAATVDVLARFLPASRPCWSAPPTRGASACSLPRINRTSA